MVKMEQNKYRKNEFFNENYDWQGVQHEVEGNQTMDYEISLEFAKHIAMMAKTKKSHQYRNYFLVCEAKIKEQQNMIGVKLSPMEILEIQFKALKEQEKEIIVIKDNVKDLKENMPLFNVECKELQSTVKSIGTKALGGYKSPAYKDNSLRGKVYSDIQHQLKREFDVSRYEAIKHSQFVQAKDIITNYKLPTALKEKVDLTNNQISMEG